MFKKKIQKDFLKIKVRIWVLQIITLIKMIMIAAQLAQLLGKIILAISISEFILLAHWIIMDIYTFHNDSAPWNLSYFC